MEIIPSPSPLQDSNELITPLSLAEGPNIR